MLSASIPLILATLLLGNVSSHFLQLEVVKLQSTAQHLVGMLCAFSFCMF